MPELHVPHLITHKGKKKVHLKRRIEKIRESDYHMKKEASMEEAFLNKNLSMKELKKVNDLKMKKNKTYNQMYANFAMNYSSTLNKMIEESHKYWAKKAIKR